MKKGLKNRQEIAEMVKVLGWSEWGMCKWLCVTTPSPSLKFFQHQQIVYWSQYIFQHPVI
jgi:hypothetical protein